MPPAGKWLADKGWLKSDAQQLTAEELMMDNHFNMVRKAVCDGARNEVPQVRDTGIRDPDAQYHERDNEPEALDPDGAYFEE